MPVKSPLSVSTVTESMLPPHLRRLGYSMGGGDATPAAIVSNTTEIQLAEAVDAYRPIYINSSGLGELASHKEGKPCYCIALEDGAAGDVIDAAVIGERATDYIFTPGAELWLGDGVLTELFPPTQSGYIIQPLGHAKTTNKIILSIGAYELFE